MTLSNDRLYLIFLPVRSERLQLQGTGAYDAYYSSRPSRRLVGLLFRECITARINEVPYANEALEQRHSERSFSSALWRLGKKCTLIITYRLGRYSHVS